MSKIFFNSSMCKSKSRLGTVLLFNVLIISDKGRFNACSSGIVVLRLVAEKRSQKSGTLGVVGGD